MPDRSGQKIGNYHLLHLLGRGSFAEVYLGEHLFLGKKAALKLLGAHVTPKDVDNFKQEAQLISNLEHPHIVEVFDCGIEEGILYLVMRHAPGGTLRQRHPKGSKLPLSMVVTYVGQIAQALQHAHDRCVIHRDVTPRNMLLGQNGKVLLSDFGIAIPRHSTRSWVPQDIAGTEAYMAPEQFKARAVSASDQYSLGIITYEWLCGARPFTEGSIGYHHVHTPPPPLRDKNPNITEVVEKIVLQALEKKPEKRFSSIRAFAEELDKASREGYPKVPHVPSRIASSVEQSGQSTRLQDIYEMPTVQFHTANMTQDGQLANRSAKEQKLYQFAFKGIIRSRASC